MKKIIIPILFLIFIFFSSNIDKDSFINTKWQLEGPSYAVIYFKHDHTFWHYFQSQSHTDSIMLCKWELKNGKLCFFNDSDKFSKSFYLEIISCGKYDMTIKDTRKNELIKYHRKDIEN